MFELPRYKEPDFSDPGFANAPDAAYGEVTIDGVAPENYHSTSMYPEYFKTEPGCWPEKAAWTPVLSSVTAESWMWWKTGI